MDGSVYDVSVSNSSSFFYWNSLHPSIKSIVKNLDFVTSRRRCWSCKWKINSIKSSVATVDKLCPQYDITCCSLSLLNDSKTTKICRLDTVAKKVLLGKTIVFFCRFIEICCKFISITCVAHTFFCPYNLKKLVAFLLIIITLKLFQHLSSAASLSASTNGNINYLSTVTKLTHCSMAISCRKSHFVASSINSYTFTFRSNWSMIVPVVYLWYIEAFLALFPSRW